MRMLFLNQSGFSKGFRESMDKKSAWRGHGMLRVVVGESEAPREGWVYCSLTLQTQTLSPALSEALRDIPRHL